MSPVRVDRNSIIIDGLEVKESPVVQFFNETPEETREEMVRRAISLGVTGLRTMAASQEVDQVERGFDRLRDQFDKLFDPDYKDSYLSQLAGTVDHYFGE